MRRRSTLTRSVAARAPDLDSIYPFRITVDGEAILHVTPPLRERFPSLTTSARLSDCVERSSFGGEPLRAARLEVWRSRTADPPFALLGLLRLVPQSPQILFIVLDQQFDRKRPSDAEATPGTAPEASLSPAARAAVAAPGPVPPAVAASAATPTPGPNLAIGWSRALRTPLHLVIGMLDLLRMSELNVEQRGYLEVAMAGANELLRAAGDLTDLTGLGFFAPIETFSMGELGTALERSYAPIAKRKRLAFKYVLEPRAALDVEGPRTRVAQVAANLIGNAIRYTTSGHVALRISRVDGDRFRFEVTDTGPGIAEDRVEKMFEPKFSEDGGLGIGLPLSRQIVERLGGQLSFETHAGFGSRFWFDVPLRSLVGVKPTPRSQSRMQRSLTPEAFSLGRPVALVVDDSLANLTIMRRYLEHLGYGTVPASSGEQALELHARASYTIVLLDIELPGIDGLETARRIRASEVANGRRPVPIVALTAHSHPEDRARCEDAGMDEHLTKPLLLAELRAVIDRLGGSLAAASPDRGPAIPTNAGLSLAVEHALALSNDDPELPAAAFEAFRIDARERLDRLREALRAKDLTAIAKLGHALRGSAAQLKLNEISRRAEAVERAAKGSDRLRIGDFVEELVGELDRFLRS